MDDNTVTIVVTSKDRSKDGISSADTRFDKLGKTAKRVGLAITAGIGAAVAGIGVGLFKAGESFDKAYDTIRVGTGATGKALESLKDDFRAVAKDVPADFEDIGTAIADLNTRTGATGPRLQALAGRVLNLSRLTGTDLAGNIADVTRLFGDWGIAVEDQAETLDKIYRASQATGVGVDDLSQLMVQFGSPLRQLGLDFETTAAMFGEFEKTGVNIQTVLPGLRMGLKNFAEAGKDPAKSLAETITKIKEASSTAEANSIAFDVFGARAGADLAAAIREGHFELDGLIDSINNGSDTIDKAARDTESFGEKWTRIKNRVLLGLEPLASKLFDAMGRGMDRLAPVMDEVTGGIRAFAGAWENADDGVTSSGFPGFMERLAITARRTFDQIQKKVEEWWPRIQEAFEQVRAAVEDIWPDVERIISDVIDTVSTIIVSAVEIITTLWENFGDNILDYVQRVWPRVQQTIHGALEIIRGVVKLVTSLIKGDWSEVWAALGDIVSGAWELIQGTIGGAIEQIRLVIGVGLEIIGSIAKGVWEGIANAADSAWSFVVDKIAGVVRWFRAIPGKIKSIASGMWNGLKSGLAGVVNWILGKAESLLNGLVSAYNNTIGRLPGVDSIDKVSLPRIGTGGGGVSDPSAYAARHGGYNARAHGGISGGVIRWGEAGIEMAKLPQGSMVYSNPDTERMMARQSGGQLTLVIDTSRADPLVQAIVNALRPYIQARHGGDVQQALGYSRS